MSNSNTQSVSHTPNQREGQASVARDYQTSAVGYNQPYATYSTFVPAACRRITLSPSQHNARLLHGHTKAQYITAVAIVIVNHDPEPKPDELTQSQSVNPAGAKPQRPVFVIKQ